MGWTVDIFVWNWNVWGGHTELSSKQRKTGTFVKNWVVKMKMSMIDIWKQKQELLYKVGLLQHRSKLKKQWGSQTQGNFLKLLTAFVTVPCYQICRCQPINPRCSLFIPHENVRKPWDLVNELDSHGLRLLEAKLNKHLMNLRVS